jgi:hypothetical protein
VRLAEAVATMQAELDARPDDWGLRLVLADALDDAPLADEAACQRWMVAKEITPVACCMYHLLNTPRFWIWGREDGPRAAPRLRPCRLPNRVWDIFNELTHLGLLLYKNTMAWKYAATRADAEALLLEALKLAGEV